MRIALVTSTPQPPQEGIGYYAYHLARELRRRGHAVTLFTRGSWRRVTVDAVDGVPVVRVPFVPLYPMHVHLHEVVFNRIFRPREAAYDLVHQHTPLPPVLRTRLPVVLTVHTPLLEDARHAEVTGWLGLAIRLQAPISARIERRLLRRADVITAVASSVADELVEYGVRPDAVRVVGNGVDADFFVPRRGPARPGGILYVGRLAHRKGLFELLEAFARLRRRRPHVRLAMVGSGPLGPALRQRIVRLGIGDAVDFVGPVGPRERRTLVGWFHWAEVYVQPSRYEGLSTAVLEAMACALPVVATAVSGHLDVIRDGENGLLVPPRDPERMAAALERVLDDPALRTHLGGRARQTVETCHTWRHVAGRLEVCYDQACRVRRGRGVS
jgi:glycosyltransferase involved in cell wall biosynthesis